MMYDTIGNRFKTADFLTYHGMLYVYRLVNRNANNIWVGMCYVFHIEIQ
jgi:hypothetical protein